MLEAEIKSEIEQLKGLLDQLECERIGELKKLTREKLQTLNEQKMRAESIQQDLYSCKHTVETKLKIMKDVVQEKYLAISDIKRAMDKHEEGPIQPELGWNIKLERSRKEKFERICQQLFEIIETDKISSENSHILEGGLEGAKVGKKSTVVFEAQTNQKSSYKGHLQLRANLVHVRSQNNQKCSIHGHKDRHNISYRPIKRGKHELHVTVNGDHVKGSPFQVAVTSSYNNYYAGRPDRVIASLSSPNGVAIDNRGQMVVIEGDGTCVSVMTTKGEKVRTFGTNGSGNGQLTGACGVTVDKNDYIYVADHSNHRIQKFDSQGVSVSTVGTSGSGNLQFMWPHGISFNHHDNFLYITDLGNHRIQVLSTEFKHVRSFGSQGEGSEQFQYPRCIAFDSANNLYVSDCNNNCVKVFTVEGQFIRSFAQKANVEKLSGPHGIAIDSNDTVYVSENGPHYVSAFNSQGAYVTTFGGKGSNEAKFSRIFGMAVDHNDSLLVADNGNHRLQVF